MNKRDVFDYISEQMTTTTEAIAAEFDTDVAEMQSILEDMEDTGAIGLTQSKRYWLIPNADDLGDEAVEAMGLDAFGAPSGDEDEPDQPPAQEPTSQEPQPAQNQSEGVSDAAERPSREDRARENFGDLAQNAPTEQGRAYWRAKLDALP